MAGPGLPLGAVLLVGVGAAFDFHSGRVPQAPRWMQRGGLEWLFRLCTEPPAPGPEVPDHELAVSSFAWPPRGSASGATRSASSEQLALDDRVALPRVERAEREKLNRRQRRELRLARQRARGGARPAMAS